VHEWSSNFGPFHPVFCLFSCALQPSRQPPDQNPKPSEFRLNTPGQPPPLGNIIQGGKKTVLGSAREYLLVSVPLPHLHNRPGCALLHLSHPGLATIENFFTWQGELLESRFIIFQRSDCCLLTDF
jgi:hypothetical protein